MREKFNLTEYPIFVGLALKKSPRMPSLWGEYNIFGR